MTAKEMQAAPGARPLNDTIAAIATAPGASGIGIIRISGSESLKVADAIAFGKNRGDLHIPEQPSHTVKYGYIWDGNVPIDEVLITVFRSPRSYTAEDTVEISCHGGTFVLRRALSLALKNGARLADPGEFTKRAFMNGRIDLTEAESVMDLISAGNEFARKNSLSILRGSILRKITELRDKLIHEAAFIESALDDPEHYSLEGYGEELKEKINVIMSELSTLIRDSGTGRVLKNGLRTVIMGRPNVGKSSVLNLLSGDDTAIVTDIPGTTRDVVTTEINLRGIPLIVFDTAGIRETEDPVESLGVERSFSTFEKSDLALLVLDSTEELKEEDLKIYDRILKEEKKCIILLNKCDLNRTVCDVSGLSFPSLLFSAKKGTGLKELEEIIEDIFVLNRAPEREEAFITSERQVSELESAHASLELVKQSIDLGMTEDFFSSDLMDAYTHLGNIIGRSTEEDLFDRIFSEFCMGK